MKKISTLFNKNPENLGLVINEINPKNQWAFDGNYIATRKYDGTAVAIINGKLYKRYDVKIAKGMIPPIGAIPCQEADTITGHHPHWVKCDGQNNENKYHFEAFDKLTEKVDGTYELCGEKIQKNPEKITGHQLIKHGQNIIELESLDFEYLKTYLEVNDIEGIVFYDTTSENMCKLRKKDFKIKR